MKSQKVMKALVSAAGRYTTGELFKINDMSADDDNNGTARPCNTTMCAQGALWAGMKPKKENFGSWINSVNEEGALESNDKTKVAKHYGLHEEAIEVIPNINDEHEGKKDVEIPVRVYAWLSFVHENARMKIAVRLLRKMARRCVYNREDAATTIPSRLVENQHLLRQIDRDLPKWLEGMVCEEHSAVKGAFTELAYAAASAEKNPKLVVCEDLVEADILTHRDLSAFRAAPRGPGWKSGVSCVRRMLMPVIKKNILKHKR